MQMCVRTDGGPILRWAQALLLVLSMGGIYATNYTDNCKLFSGSESERQALSQLEPLTKKNFTITAKTDTGIYTYVFQLCGDAGGVPGAGVIQVDTSDKTTKTTIIGMYNATRVIPGSNLVMLIYRNGEKYDNHCSNEMRKANVWISCNRDADTGHLKVVREDRDGREDCYYLLELDSSAVCPAIDSHLGAGSIILLIGFCLLAVYLIGGFLYQRLVVGAKGMEQLPNIAFWKEVGNLSADGCDFVCRSRDRDEPPAYRGVATEPLEDEPEERDDHLLPM